MEEKKQTTTIDDYINQYPEDVRVVLEELRHVIKEEAPDATE